MSDGTGTLVSDDRQRAADPLQQRPTDAVRRHVEAMLRKQEAHPVYAAIEVDFSLPYDLGGVWVRTGDGTDGCERWSIERLMKALETRADILRKEKQDPYRGGYEPEIWRETDWRLAELRCTYPGEPIFLGILGGNGGGKSFYCGSRFAMCVVENENWYCLQLALDQSGSRKIPQKITHDYLPLELRPESGKLKKTATTKLTWNGVNGFTDDTFGLENGSQAEYKFYGGGDVNSMEGLRPDMVWADEMVPLEWVRAAGRRLVTKAERSTAIIEQLKLALAVRAEMRRRREWSTGSAGGRVSRSVCNVPAMEVEGDTPDTIVILSDEEVWKKYLRPILPKLFQGVCVVSFTPKNGYSRTVAMLDGKAKTLWEVQAELLPVVKNGTLVRYEKVPRVKVNPEERAMVVFFHIYDNKHGGNWTAQKSRLSKLSRSEKLWQAYGVATKTANVLLPLFKREAHVRPQLWLPPRGCWYHIVDPCEGRNWFMQWWRVCPRPGGKPLLFCAREWPQPGDYIVAGDIGNPGEWAVLEEARVSEGRKKSVSDADGARGPAQQSWGLGYRQYADEIERVEKELFKLERRVAGDENWAGAEGRIELLDGCRIMDSRAANNPTQTHGESVTLIELMVEYDLHFLSAGRDSGAELGKTYIGQGVDMINDALNYDLGDVELIGSAGAGDVTDEVRAPTQQRPTDPMVDAGYYKFHGRAPRVMIAENCANTIFCAGSWTGRGGGENPLKDPVDCMRYLVISNPEPIEAGELLGYGGGSY